MIAIASVLIVATLSLLVSRIATVALTLTGLSREVARFQARSALTGTGYTTTESEMIVNHPVRRRIVMMLMILRNAGFITAVSSLVISFVGTTGAEESLRRVLLLAAGLGAIWLLSLSKAFDRWLSRLIRVALNRWTRLEARDYASLLDLTGDYAVREIAVDEEDWICSKQIRETGLQEEGIMILGIQRGKGHFLGAPAPDTRIRNGDMLVIYGRTDSIEELTQRRKGTSGDVRHEEAVREQEAVEEEEKREDSQREEAKPREGN